MALTLLWERLLGITRLEFRAKSGRGAAGWNGFGQGKVETTFDQNNNLIFSETGKWNTSTNHRLGFTNVFRWSTDASTNNIHLSHLRYGPDKAVYLFSLTNRDQKNWRVVAPHHCKDDVYTAKLVLMNDSLDLHWEVNGPNKQEFMHYQYT